MASETITLGGRTFALAPLRLGQLRDVLDALDAMAGKSGGALVEAAARIIHAGLVRGEPALTIDAVLEMEGTMDQVNAAVAAIIRVAGLKPAGETEPVADWANSTAPSPPAAATPTGSSTT
ncbi:MAG: hypothetical protein JO038_01420 [Alphaproteobacteria bacterium]|nr:hypothetical protein [Alphaproteobacteria bacterium]